MLEAASSSEMAVNMVIEQGGVPFRGENTSFEIANRRGRGCAIRRNQKADERPITYKICNRNLLPDGVCKLVVGHACGMPRFMFVYRAKQS